MIDFDAFWIEHSAALHRFIQSKVGRAEVAEDILHDVYIKARSNTHRLREVKHTRAWVYQICRSTMADYYRGAYREPQDPLPPDLAQGLGERGSSVWKMVAEAIDCKIHHLPRPYQGAISLFALNGLSEKQVSVKLKLSLPATKSRILRARHKLRSMFERCCAFDFEASEPLIVWEEFEKNIMSRSHLSLLTPSALPYFDS